MRTTLPRGNVIEYGYDAAGRLVSVERKPDAATPGERTLYTLDGLWGASRMPPWLRCVVIALITTTGPLLVLWLAFVAAEARRQQV